MDINALKENIFAEINTMTEDQRHVILKVMIDDFCAIVNQEATMAMALDSIQHALIEAEKIDSYKNLSRAVTGIRRSLGRALIAHRDIQLTSAGRLKRALQTIDPIAGHDPVQ